MFLVYVALHTEMSLRAVYNFVGQNTLTKFALSSWWQCFKRVINIRSLKTGLAWLSQVCYVFCYNESNLVEFTLADANGHNYQQHFSVSTAWMVHSWVKRMLPAWNKSMFEYKTHVTLTKAYSQVPNSFKSVCCWYIQRNSVKRATLYHCWH